jgi:uncharacterized membrane protein
MIFKKLFSIIKKYFISGVLVVVPLILTYLVLKFLFETIDGILQPLIYRVLGYSVFGLGVFVTILLIILAGIFTRNIIGNKIYQLGDKIIVGMPIIRPIYSAAKQLIEAVSKPSMESFKEVVLVEYPRKGVYALGFISNRMNVETEDITNTMYSVFVPSTPTPVSGMVILFPKNEVITLNMSVEDGVKFLVSGGVASPDMLKQKTISDNNVKNIEE